MFVYVSKSAPDRPRGSLEALKFLPQTAVFEVLGDPGGVNISLKMVPTWLQNGSKIDPGASWRALGAVLAAWSALGGLLERCWSALGGLRGRKKDLLSGSWALQEESQDRFQPSWRPKGSQTGAQKRAKTRSQSDSSSKVQFL